MRIALIQQRAATEADVIGGRGLETLDRAASQGPRLVCFAEFAFEPFSPQRRLFQRDHRAGL